jgi:hypothetical protein
MMTSQIKDAFLTYAVSANKDYDSVFISTANREQLLNKLKHGNL